MILEIQNARNKHCINPTALGKATMVNSVSNVDCFSSNKAKGKSQWS